MALTNDQATAHFQHLRTLDSVADGRAYLDSLALGKPDLVTLCRASGIHPQSSDNKARLTGRILTQAIGARRKFDGLRSW